MSLRDIEKEKTAQKARAAMERIKSGTPNNLKLKKRKNLKLNQNTVEIETGLSVRALKHHPEILTEIMDYKAPRIDSGDNNASDVIAVLLKRENEKLKEQKKKALKATRNTQESNEKLSDKIDKLERENKALHKRHAEMVSALFNMIPQEAVNGLFEKDFTPGNKNVVPIK